MDNELSRHRRSRAHATWMLAPVAATMTGTLKNRYNLGTNNKRTEVNNNAFLMSAFLLTKELPGQSNEAFRGEREYVRVFFFSPKLLRTWTSVALLRLV